MSERLNLEEWFIKFATAIKDMRGERDHAQFAQLLASRLEKSKNAEPLVEAITELSTTFSYIHNEMHGRGLFRADVAPPTMANVLAAIDPELLSLSTLESLFQDLTRMVPANMVPRRIIRAIEERVRVVEDEEQAEVERDRTIN